MQWKAMRKLMPLFFLMVWLVPVQGKQKSLSEDAIKRSVIKIKNYSQDFDYKAPWNLRDTETSYGTGFLVGPRLIMTNAHVVAQSRLLRVQRNEGTRWYKARILYIGHDCDLAVVTVDDADFFKGMSQIPMSGLPKLNTQVGVYGFPVGGDKLSITLGIVSRIEAQEYAHSEIDSHLAIQVDAAINSGNSGGPVLQNGRLIGVAFQSFVNAENTGYVIPTPVVRHFLSDIKDKRYDGYVDIGITTLNLTNSHMRKFVKLPADKTGVIAISVIPGSGADKVLKEGDILTKIQGKTIANDGTIQSGGIRRYYTSIVETMFQGDIVEIEIIRDGKVFKKKLKLKVLDIIRYQANNFERYPRYFLQAGLLFQPMTKNVLESGRGEWSQYKRSLQIYLYFNFLRDRIYKARREFVLLYSVLPDPINTYYNSYGGLIVDKVNGIKVENIEHMADIWLAADGDFIRIDFLMHGTPLLLPRTEIVAANRRIKRRYKVGKTRHLEKNKKVTKN